MAKSRFYENIFPAKPRQQPRPEAPVTSRSDVTGAKSPAQQQKFRISKGSTQSTGFFQIVGDIVVACQLRFDYGPVDVNVDPQLARFVTEIMAAGASAFKPHITATIQQIDEEALLQARDAMGRPGHKILDPLINFLRRKARDEKIARMAAQSEPIKVELVSPTEVQNPPREIVVRRDKSGNMIGAVVKDA